MPLNEQDCGCGSNSPIVEIENVIDVDCVNNVSCKTKNWTKCILYSGPSIGCSSTTGGIQGFTFSGTGADAGIYTTSGLSATGGSGSGAVFRVVGNALNTNYAVTVTTAGSGYKVGDVLTIAGNLIQGSFTAPANNVTITVTTLSNIVVSNSALITPDMNLDLILNILNERICNLTPEGVDYSGFSYSCLRVGGNLESTGTVISTQKQFVEATSVALCSLNTRLKVLETPDVTPGCISSIVGGETLIELLDKIIEEICIVKEFQQLPIDVTASCFTTVPSSSVDISAWFQWIVDNTCSIKSNLESSITAQTTRINNINTYLHGSNTPSYPIVYNNTCLGGSSSSNVHQTLTNLITKVCQLDTALGDLPDLDNIVLTWASCFSSSPYSYNNTAQPLQTQLERILNVISREKCSFSSDFTVTDSACGKTIELSGSFGFSCSSLSSCSIGNLGDVDLTGITTGKKLYWNGTAFVPVADDTFEHLGTNNKSGSYSSYNLGFHFEPVNPVSYPKEYKTFFVERSWTPVASFGSSYNTPVFPSTVNVKRTWDNNLLFKGYLFSNAVPSSFYNIPVGVVLCTLPTNFFPSRVVNVQANITFITNSPAHSPVHLNCSLNINTSGVVTMTLNIGSFTALNTYITDTNTVTGLNNPNLQHSISFEALAIYE